MAIKVLIDADKKVISYHGTDLELKTVDEVTKQPEPKVGIDYIPYYDESQEKVVYKERQRALTDRELYEQLAARQEATAQAVQEIALNSLGGL